MDLEQPNAAFVSFLRRHRDQILAEWEQRVRALPPAASLDATALIDHLPVILDDIADAADAELAGEAPRSLKEHPDRHALARLHQGYELGQVVTEYSLLREVIQDLSTAQESAYPKALRVFNRVLDDAIRQAVHRYSEASERMLKALDRISMLVFGGRDEGALLEILLEIMIQAAPAVDEVTLLLKHGDELHVRAAVGISKERGVDFSIEVGDGFSGHIAERREPLFVRSAETDPRVKSPFLKQRGIKALYGVPLMDGTELIGVAHMGSATAYEFLDEDMLLFRAMVNRASQLIIETRLEAEVRHKAEELEAVLASAQLGSFTWDLRTRDIRWDAHARALFAVDEQPTYQEFLARVAPEDRVRLEAAIGAALASGGEYRARYRIIRPDGEERHVVARGAVVVENGEPVRFLGTVQDRTEEEYAERERELFLAALGHDLRGPLGAITLAASNLMRHAALPEAVSNTVARIARSSDRMTRLIEQLLDFARARAGQPLAVTRRQVELAELWQQLLDEVTLSDPNRRVTLRCHGSSYGEWDADRMLQVFQNLLSNAIQYGDPEQPIAITLDSDGSTVVCEVHNQGAPIPARVMPVLFDPFRRGHKGGRGLGLGLYIARQIVEAHGGTIEAASSAEAGTTFRLVMPLRR